MDEHPNVTAARRGYEAFNRGDLDSCRELFADDVTWHQGGHDALSGDYEGIDGVFDLFGKMLELTGGDYRAELIDVHATDHRTMALERSVATRNGKTLDEVHPVIFEGDVGKTREVWSYHFDDDANAAFWS